MTGRETGDSRTSRTYPTPIPKRQPNEHHAGRVFLLALLSVVCLFILLAGAALASYQLVYSQRIPLGVQLLDLDVGGLGLADAKQLLSANLEAYLRTPLAFRQGSREWKSLPGEMGASFNVEESISRAFKLGQEGNIFERMQRQISLLQHPQRLGLAFVFNDVSFQGGLARLVQAVEQPPQDATIKLVGTEVAITPARPGYQIDRQALQAQLRESLASLSTAPVELPVKSIPPQVREENLAQARAQIQKILAEPVTVRYGERRWTLDRAALSNMFSFQQGKDANGNPTAQPVLASDKAEAWAKEVAKEVDKEPQDARIVWNDGRLTINSPGRPGVSVETAKFGEALNKALAKGDRVVDLPVVAKPAAGAEDIARLGIQDKLAEASTSYAGTMADRIHNVRLGAQRINGKVVPPGGIYSMAEALGPISEDTGYKLGFAILGPDTVLDVGGGLSQLTTTVFKAAFAAGFPITQRTTHAYRIRRYEPILGIEATIYPPAVDLKFRNDTDHYILLDARTDAGNVYISFYGTRPNREITVEGPIIENVVPTTKEIIRTETPLLPKGQEITSEVAEDGLDVTVYRIIKVGGK
ncbi:MAG: VanW family protein, partial [Dehalococcoidia bacterium]|nr:VanW family protein [Dehalococcoidia bacterium]